MPDRDRRALRDAVRKLPQYCQAVRDVAAAKLDRSQVADSTATGGTPSDTIVLEPIAFAMAQAPASTKQPSEVSSSDVIQISDVPSTMPEQSDLHGVMDPEVEPAAINDAAKTDPPEATVTPPEAPLETPEQRQSTIDKAAISLNSPATAAVPEVVPTSDVPSAVSDESTRNLAILTNPPKKALYESVSIQRAATYAGVSMRQIREHMRGPNPAIQHLGAGRHRRPLVSSLIKYYPPIQ